jgi:Na+-translocating ferredoxin:NAD+ oxidoreductase RnfD subunit
MSAVPAFGALTYGESRPNRLWRFWRSPKGTLLLVFAPILAIAGAAQGPRTVAPVLLAAVLGACFVELAVTWGVTGRWQFPSSALITGLIVAMVLSPHQSWAIGAVASAIAVASKYVLRTRREHIFNPAALGLVAVILIFGADESWWGAMADLAWPLSLVTLVGGAIVAERINKFPLVLAFVGSYFLVCLGVSFVAPTAVAEMFRNPYAQSALFLAVFMLTDPPTSPNRYGEQVWFGALAGVVSVLAQLVGFGEAFLLLGVLVANAVLAAKRDLGRLATQRA